VRERLTNSLASFRLVNYTIKHLFGWQNDTKAKNKMLMRIEFAILKLAMFYNWKKSLHWRIWLIISLIKKSMRLQVRKSRNRSQATGISCCEMFTSLVSWKQKKMWMWTKKLKKLTKTILMKEFLNSSIWVSKNI
jgi:hypothetical protein